jgi:hypothetical protein
MENIKVEEAVAANIKVVPRHLPGEGEEEKGSLR